MTAKSRARPRTVLFDLDTLLDGDVQKKKYLLHYLDRDGLELVVLSERRSRRDTRELLRTAGLLRYLDDITYSQLDLPADFFPVIEPDHCRYSYIAEHCIEPRRRPFPLALEAF